MNLDDLSSFDRTRPPAARPPARLEFPRFSWQELHNGLRVIHAPFDRGPLVSLAVVTGGGGQLDPMGKAGLAALAASLLDEGTERHTSLELARRAEDLGGYLATQADWDSMSAASGVLSDHLEPALGLLAEVMTEANFPDHEVERVRSQRLAELQRRLAQPAAIARDVFSTAVYQGTAYGNPLLGTVDTVAGLTRDDVVALHRQQISPRGSTLLVVGQYDSAPARDLVEEIFEGWQGSDQPTLMEIELERVTGLQIHLVDRPDAAQTELRLGHSGIPRDHPDFCGLQVMNSLLGGKFTSRINLNLRERLGITYGVSSSFARRRGPGPFVVAASIDTEAAGQAVTEIVSEIRRLQDEPVSSAEIEDTKSFLIGVFPYSLQTIEGLCTRLAELALFDLPDDYYETYLDQIRQVDAAEIMRLARAHLHLDQLTVVAVGPAASLATQLEKLAPVSLEIAS